MAEVKLRDGYWYSFLAVTGATSIAVEIVGLRFLAPLFGSSLPVWGVAIATVLAGLAWGYSKGGMMAQRAATGAAVGLVFRQATVGATLFLWMPVLFFAAGRWQDQYFSGGEARFLLAAFGVSYLSLLIPSVIFGMVSPLAVQAESERREQSAGQVAGRISALTTWGSLAGILLPSLLLIPLLGTRMTVWVFAGLTWLFCEWYMYTNKPSWRIARWWAVAGVGLTLVLQQTGVNVLAAMETAHQHVEVLEVTDGRALIFDAKFGLQSFLPEGLYTDKYWDYLAGLPLFFREDELQVLVVGAAASTTERQMERFWAGHKQLQFTSVELDGELFAVADQYFDAPERRRVTADGRAFVAGDDEQYDIIVVDAYARELTVPFHLATSEFFGLVAKRLKPGGVVAVNLNAGSAQSLWPRSMARTVGEHWPQLALVSVPDSCNFLLLASDEKLEVATDIPEVVTRLALHLQEAVEPARDGWLLTDDKAATDWLGIGSLVTSSDETCT